MERSKPTHLIKPSNLSIYEEPQDVFNYEYYGREKSRLEETVGTFTKEFRTLYDTFAETRQSLNYIYQTGKAHSLVTIDYLKDEENVGARGGAIGLGGIVGFVFGGWRKGIIKKLFYASLGSGGAASLLYPKEASEISREFYNNASDYSAIAYNFIVGVKPQGSEGSEMSFQGLQKRFSGPFSSSPPEKANSELLHNQIFGFETDVYKFYTEDSCDSNDPNSVSLSQTDSNYDILCLKSSQREWCQLPSSDYNLICKVDHSVCVRRSDERVCRVGYSEAQIKESKDQIEDSESTVSESEAEIMKSGEISSNIFRYSAAADSKKTGDEMDDFIDQLIDSMLNIKIDPTSDNSGNECMAHSRQIFNSGKITPRPELDTQCPKLSTSIIDSTSPEELHITSSHHLIAPRQNSLKTGSPTLESDAMAAEEKDINQMGNATPAIQDAAKVLREFDQSTPRMDHNSSFSMDDSNLWRHL